MKPKVKKVIGVTLALLFLYLVYNKFVYNTISKARILHHQRSSSVSQNIQNYKNAEQIYQYKVSQNPQALIDLGHLYYEGLPDKYDTKGNKVKGISPNVRKAKNAYYKAYKQGLKSGLLFLANLYYFEFTLHNNFDDREKAIEYYNQLLTDIEVSPEIRANATAMLMEINKVGMNPFADYYRMDVGGIGNYFQAPRRAELPQLNRAEPLGNQRTNALVYQEARIRNDSHNAHDHGIVNSIKNAIRILRGKTHLNKSIPESLHEIRMYISENTQGDRQRDAIRVLDRIESNTDEYGGLGISEPEALSLVWNRIHMFGNDQHINLKSNLINELSEAVEHGNVVCSTGRFNRIVDSLNGIDPDVVIKPKWVLNQEMLSKAAKIREETLASASKHQVDAVNELKPTPEQEQLASSFDETLKKNILSQLQQEYVGTGALEQKIFDSEVNKWIDSI